jgi:purine-binding chemotaxis protein CheW
MENLENNEQNKKQLLTFVLNGELYGIDILRIQEIKDLEPCTPIPNAPEWVKGVINLRGSVVPIFDLRKMFFNIDKETGVVIVLNLIENGKRKIAGIVIDTVSNTEFADPELLQQAPKNTKNIEQSFIEGLVSIEDKMVIVMNVDQIDFFK